MKTTFKQKPIVLLILLFTCLPSLVPAQNLIGNSSFEDNGLPSGQGWHGYVTDTSDFSQDVPPGGGSWSLKLWPGWIPQEGYAETYITGLTGTKIFQLKTWMKAVGAAIGPGYTCLYLKDQPFWFLTSPSCRVDTASTWKQFTLTDTFTLQPADTLVVHLSAGGTEVAAWSVLFDLPELTILSDSLTGIASGFLSRALSIYPNPTTGKFVIITEGEEVTVEITDAVGQLIFREHLPRSLNYQKEIDLSRYSNGVYHVRLTAKDGECVNRKIVKAL